MASLNGATRHDRFLWASWLLLAAGVGIRSFHYLQNRSLWFDEALLALNFLERSGGELVGRIGYAQKGPAGFLLGVDLLQETFGSSEYTLRFLPFVFGTLSLLLFYSLAKRWLSPPAMTLILAVFAFSPLPVYYSSELKEYSADLFCSLLLVWMAAGVISGKPIYNSLLAIAGVLTVWFSFPSAFVLGAIGTGLITKALSERKWQDAILWSVTSGLWLISFAFHQFLMASHLHRVNWANTSLGSAFLPILPDSKWDLAWLYTIFPEVVLEKACGVHGWLGLLFLLTGLLAAWQKDRLVGWILFGPLLFALLSSGFYLYPIQQRFVLFAVPGLLLLVALGWQSFLDHLKVHRRAVALLSALLLISNPLYESAKVIVQPEKEEIRDVLLYLSEHKQEDDKVHLYMAARYAFLYYREVLGLESWEYTVGNGSFGGSTEVEWRKWDQSFAKMSSQNAKIWFVFSHVQRLTGLNEEQLILFLLNRYGQLLDEVHARGASAYLYSFQQSSPPEAPFQPSP